MSSYFVEHRDGEQWLLGSGGPCDCDSDGEFGHEKYCGVVAVAPLRELLSRPAGALVLSAEAFTQLAEREGREPNEKLVELLCQTRRSVVFTDVKSVRIRELETELEKRTASLEMLVEAHRVLREERDELAAQVARVDDHIQTLMMDRENWGRADRLQNLLDGTESKWQWNW